jgi:hypothetical protein
MDVTTVYIHVHTRFAYPERPNTFDINLNNNNIIKLLLKPLFIIVSSCSFFFFLLLLNTVYVQMFNAKTNDVPHDNIGPRLYYKYLKTKFNSNKYYISLLLNSN